MPTQQRIVLIAANRLIAKSCMVPNRLHDCHVYDLLATRVATCGYSMELMFGCTCTYVRAHVQKLNYCVVAFNSQDFVPIRIVNIVLPNLITVE